jgi:hypothetical protein
MPYWIFHFFSLHFVLEKIHFVSFRFVRFRFVSISFRTLQVPQIFKVATNIVFRFCFYYTCMSYYLDFTTSMIQILLWNQLK